VVAENQSLHDENERLATEVKVVERDVNLAGILLRNIKREVEKVEVGVVAKPLAGEEELCEGEVTEKTVVVFVDAVPEQKTMERWAAILWDEHPTQAPWREE
jgi:hypothetical protein